MEQLFLLIGTLLAGLASGLALSHVLEIPGKRDMDDDLAIGVQQHLYRGYRTPAAVIEVGVLGATIAAGIFAADSSASFWLTVAAAGTTLCSLITFVTITGAQNRRILRWSTSEMPDDWKATRTRWELSHGVRAILFLLTASLLAGAMLSV